MKLELKASGLFSFSEMQKDISAFLIPALLADRNFKIRAKSNTISEDVAGFRIGARLDRLLSNEDREKLFLLEEGKMFVAELVSAAPMGYATVIKGSDCFFVCLRRLADSICERMIERCGRFSGYDVGFNAFVSAVFADACTTQNSKAFAEAVERLLNELSDVHRLPFFDFSATVSKLFYEIGEASRSMARRIDIPKSLPETVAVGSGDDLVLVTAFLLSLCLDCVCSGNVVFSAVEQDGEICMTFSCNVENDETGLDSFVSAFVRRNGFSHALDGPSFWAFLVKLLADCNLWEISATRIDRYCEFRLKVPSVARGEEFYVRDPDTESMSAILYCLFAEKEKF